eukprot:scaffold19948_cov90-Isochrysis_galbana.AAC.3
MALPPAPPLENRYPQGCGLWVSGTRAVRRRPPPVRHRRCSAVRAKRRRRERFPPAHPGK